jgi:hypothetical protein
MDVAGHSTLVRRALHRSEHEIGVSYILRLPTRQLSQTLQLALKVNRITSGTGIVIATVAMNGVKREGADRTYH